MAEVSENIRKLSRRQFVKGAAAGAVGVAAVGALGSCGEAATPETCPTCPPAPTCPPEKECEACPEPEPCPTCEPCPPCEASTPWLPEKWDYETDVVILGNGFAGQAAAIEAHDAGASVILLEKAPEEFAGGNSRVCGQGIICPSPDIWDGYCEYIKAMTAGQGFPVPDDFIRTYVESSYHVKEWLEGMGAEVIPWMVLGFGDKGKLLPFFPNLPGAEAVASEPGCYSLPMELGVGRIWYFLQDQLLERSDIQRMYMTPAKRLIQDPLTKEVLGVVAETSGEEIVREDGGREVTGGTEIFVKAKKGVIVCTGGYEFNNEMVRDFQNITACYSPGGPYNTGEGIKMSWAAGADLWHMGVLSSPFSLSAGMKEEWRSSISVAVGGITTTWPRAGGMIMVGANNKRWRDEFRNSLSHMGWPNRENAAKEGAAPFVGVLMENGVYVRDKFPQPMHCIFDEAARLSGPFFSGSFSTQVEGYKCSEDNSAELEAGWIVQANSVRELAEKLGRDPDALVATVEKWNESCEAGKDLEFDTGDPNFVPYDRPQELLNPIALEGEPVYAVQVYPCSLNTQGGMRRNTECQVLDIWKNPIPRLYAAGELGDIWSYMYQCCSNAGAGCLGHGAIAGRNVVAETPWEGA
jgi:succinate dehydrogenase/fumarate reductase flavoprotein subunit